MTAPSWLSVAVVVAFGAGFWAGYHEESQKFEQFRVKVEARAMEAKVKNEEIEKRHEQTTQLIEQTYQAELDLLDDYYRRMLDNNASSGRVSPVPAAPSGSHGAPRCQPIPMVTKECAQAALRLRELQEWVSRVNQDSR